MDRRKEGRTDRRKEGRKVSLGGSLLPSSSYLKTQEVSLTAGLNRNYLPPPWRRRAAGERLHGTNPSASLTSSWILTRRRANEPYAGPGGFVPLVWDRHNKVSQQDPSFGICYEASATPEVAHGCLGFAGSLALGWRQGLSTHPAPVATGARTVLIYFSGLYRSAQTVPILVASENPRRGNCSG